MITFTLIVAYVIFGLIVMGLESRWCLMAYLDALNFKNKLSGTYQERVSKEKDKALKESKSYLFGTFFLWCFFLALGILYLLAFFMTKAWCFFYNGFRPYPLIQENTNVK